MNEETMKKITLAGLKSFIRKHKENLFIKVKSDFDGMTDGVEPVKMNWRKVDPESVDFSNEYTLGIAGVWLVGSSRDRISMSTDGDFISVYNCCGHWCLSLTND